MTKTIFITGTSSGIGRATVEHFVLRGWNVAVTMRKMECAHIFEQFPNVRVFQLEMTDFTAMDQVVQQAIDTFGKVDVLVNNAGYYHTGPLETSTMEQIRAQYETNIFSVIALTKAFIPHFSANGAGAIVNLSSISAENGYPFSAIYSSSKAAVATLTEALNVELDALGIHVKAIFPGTHATKIFTKVDTTPSIPPAYQSLLRRFVEQQRAIRGGRPEGVARVIYEAVTDGKQDKVRYYAGPDATVIPRAKRLLGQEGYFRFFRRSILQGISPLVRPFLRQGDAEIEVKLDLNV
jgi:NAD(P)-dependent dehydrogenase (short-subunit alcohol dehydrogenase family)